MSGNRGKGAAYKFLAEHVHWNGDDCVSWPFFNIRGYGVLSYNGKNSYAHRLMCTMAHGAPSDAHQAAHSCGNGAQGCVNPRHLSWKTPSENNQDQVTHGTSVKHRNGSKGILTQEQAETIRSLKGVVTQRILAARFNVSERAISHVQNGRTFSRPSRVNFFSPTEDESIARMSADGVSFSAIAKAINRTSGSVSRRARTLGVESPYNIDLARRRALAAQSLLHVPQERPGFQIKGEN